MQAVRCSLVHRAAQRLARWDAVRPDMWHSLRSLTGLHRLGAAAGAAAGGVASGAADGAVALAPATAPERTRSCTSASIQSAQESGMQSLCSESARKRCKGASLEVSYTGTRMGVVRHLSLDGKE